MIDTHAHLSKRFCDNPKVTGVKVILAASNVADSSENIKLANNNLGQFWASVGIHPQATDPENLQTVKEQLEELENLIEADRKNLIVAVGETGLDFSTPPPAERERGPKEQEYLFCSQIELAKKYNLPLIIHARKAVEEVIEILAKHKELKGVFHCWAGGKKRIDKVLGLGADWYFGIDGNLTYEIGLDQVVGAVPKDRLVLETDSPFLTPLPHRGETNKPENVIYVYQKMAEIWKISFQQTEKIIDNNVKRLFGI